MLEQDTIVAISTPPGRGGVGMIRLSGADSLTIAQSITGRELYPRKAVFSPFIDNKQTPPAVLDEGIALYFQAPHSFTGEDVVELHGHGSPVVLDELVMLCLSQGARMARPGEFSERAFLNGKLDLAQAEAVADLISSSSREAARNAVRSLQGEFSRHIHQLVEELVSLRSYIEAAIDFPEEEIDFLADSDIPLRISRLIASLEQTLECARQGRVLHEGITVVIAGRPNAGKSSLLNALAGHEAAIVTDIAGTTRDLLREKILIGGMPLHILDTAGLRESSDPVEKEGIRRAWKAMEQADALLLVIDSTLHPEFEEPGKIWPDFSQLEPMGIPITLVWNKCDTSGEKIAITSENGYTVIRLSAKKTQGIELLQQHLQSIAGLTEGVERGFTARRRHTDALERARNHLLSGHSVLERSRSGELLAEELRYCQQALNEITGEFTSDDLLGKIFSDFCIGK